MAAGTFSVPISIKSLFSESVIFSYIRSHATFSLILAFLILQYYLFTSKIRLVVAIFINVCTSLFVFLIFIPSFLMIGLTKAEDDSSFTFLQNPENGIIYGTDDFQYTYLDTVLISANPENIPILSSRQTFYPSLLPKTEPLIGHSTEVTWLEMGKDIEQNINNYFSKKLETGYLSYIIQFIGIALVLASLWPSLKISSWNALNSFAFSATVIGIYTLLKWLIQRNLYEAIKNPPNFLTEQSFLFIEYAIIVLICNVGGVLEEFLHKTLQKERS